MADFEKKQPMLDRRHFVGGALAAMKCDLDNAVQDKPENPEQPELPIMKNNDQRKAFLETFRDWPVWFSPPPEVPRKS